MKRVLDVVRIQSVSWVMLVALPVGILALTFLLNYAIFALLGDAAAPEGRVTGALMSIYLVLGISHLQSMTQTFPFALGISVTRRDFYAGTGVVVVAQSIAFGLLLTLLELLERATGGWGIGLKYFGLPFLVQDNVIAQWLVYTVPFLAISALGVFMGVVFKRWGQLGVYVATVGAAVLLTAAALVITWRQWWPAVGEFLGSQPPMALFAGYPMVVALVAGAAGWLAIRRATP